MFLIQIRRFKLLSIILRHHIVRYLIELRIIILKLKQLALSVISSLLQPLEFGRLFILTLLFVLYCVCIARLVHVLHI